MQRIFDLLQEQNVTQYTLSKAIGVSQGNISDWKSGRAAPKADALLKIADYFGVSVDYLLGRTAVREPVGISPVPLSADAAEVAAAYFALPTVGEKNMIRGALGLSPLADQETSAG